MSVNVKPSHVPLCGSYFWLSLTSLRQPSHPMLNAFISHMGQGSRGHWESSLGSAPRLPNHSVCEMGELTQTGREGRSHPHKISSTLMNQNCSY